MRVTRIRSIAIGVAWTSLSCLAWGQNLLCNGGFESPQFPANLTQGDVPCWQTTSSQGIEVQNKKAGYALGVIGSQYVELDVATNSDIYQDFPTVIGQRYRIRFWAANRIGSPRSAFRILWDGALLGTVARDASRTTFGAVVGEVVATKSVSRIGIAADGPSDGVGDLIDEVSVIPVPEAGSRMGWVYYLPHYADGGGWASTLALVNTSPYFAADVQYTIYGDNGAILDPLLNGTATLGPFASTSIESPRGALLRVGWVRVVSSEPLQSSLIFRSIQTGRLDLEATVLAREPTSEIVAPFDNATFVTGFAAANPGAAPLTLTFTFRESAGGAFTTVTKQLPANAHTSFAFNDQFAATAGKKGAVEIKATNAAGDPVQFVPLGLRFNSGGAFTTLPY